MRAEPSPREPEAAGPPIFLADAMLGRLATWLRILGFDAAYSRQEDSQLVARARREGRILLTRDTRLLARRDAPPHLLIAGERVAEQLREVAGALGLDLTRPAAARCPRCNTRLEALSRAEAAGRVPAFVWSQHAAFSTCPACRRVYWPGTHRRRMDEVVRRLGEG